MGQGIACQLFDAGHDVNGNPRRVWVVYGADIHPHGEILAAWDNGYYGMPDELRAANLTRLPDVPTSAKHYRAILRAFGRSVYVPF